jgi:hypothetical protein
METQELNGVNRFKTLTEQPTQDKPYLVANYPYGFRLRTQIRYWVETTKQGQRFCSQTLNPKTNLWNNPKKSTYSQIVLIGLDENEHITFTSFSASYRSLAEAETFERKYAPFLSEYQLKELKGIKGLLKVYDKVEFEIVTKRYKDVRTGEIKTQVGIFDLAYCVEVDEDGNEVNQEQRAKEKKEQNIALNKLAILSARNEQKGSIPDAIGTFERA